MKDLQWIEIKTNHWFTTIGKIRVEKQINSRGTQFSIGPMETALFKFQTEYQLMKYLTI
jgi:hypothetical protein